MRAVFLVAILLASVSSAQGIPRSGSRAPSGSDHAGQAVQAQSVTTSASSGTVAVRLDAGAKACFDGATSAACITYEIVGDVLRLAKPLEVSKVTTTDATNGLILADGSRICLNGASCTQTLRNSASNATFSGGVVAGGVNSTGSVSFTTYVSGSVNGSPPTCASGVVNRIYILSGTPARWCLCTDIGGSAYQWVNLLDPSDLTGTASNCPTR